MLLFFEHKIEPCRFPHLWLRRNNGTFTVLRCTVGIRCFTVSVYFLLQINFLKSIFDLLFWLIWPFRYFMKFWNQFLVLTYATVNLNSFRNMFALFKKWIQFSFAIYLVFSNVAIGYDLLLQPTISLKFFW